MEKILAYCYSEGLTIEIRIIDEEDRNEDSEVILMKLKKYNDTKGSVIGKDYQNAIEKMHGEIEDNIIFNEHRIRKLRESFECGSYSQL